MNILHTETLGGWGGQQNKVIKELVATRELGHGVFLLCNPGTPIGQRARELDITVYEYPMNQWTQFTTAALYALDLIHKLEIDVLITHSSSDSWMGGFAGRLSRRKPVLMRERHNLHSIVGWPSIWLHRFLFHYLLAISETVKDYLTDQIGVAPEKILILPSVVSVRDFEAVQSGIRQELSIPPDARVFGMFSLLRVNKGIYDFLEVVKSILPKHKNTYAIFGGKTNPDRIAEFTRELESSGIDTRFVRWTGFRQDVANVMKGYDVFVFPSHSEGLGTVLLEAMAAGLPVVTYDKRPMSDLVVNGENGYAVAFGDLEALAEKIQYLLENEEERRQMAQRSLGMAKAHHDEPKLKTAMRAILEVASSG